MIATTMTILKKDYHNDVKQVALDLRKDQSRISLYTYKIREKLRDFMLI